MQGIGNDFVMIDLISSPIQCHWSDLAREMCDRKFGVGSDGLILLEKGSGDHFKMVMFNPDGSESEMCGNGIRCFARLAQDQGYLSGDNLSVETGAGLLHLHIHGDNQVRVDMGVARLGPSEIGMSSAGNEPYINQSVNFEGLHGTAVSMGNPHLVIFVENVAAIDLPKWGPALEHSSLFLNRTNVHFVQVLSPNECIQRTWERGAGITLACGTGACSVAVAGKLNGLLGNSCLIHLPGGDLSLEVQEDLRVFMTGPAETVFEGKWESKSEKLASPFEPALS